MALDQTYLQVSDGAGDAALMHVTSNRSIGSTILNVDTLVHVPTKFIATSGTLLSTGFIDSTTITNFYGHINGSALEIDGFLSGSVDAGNTTGQVVVIKPNTFWANFMAGLAIALPGANIVDGSVTTAKINDGAVTAAKMGSVTTVALAQTSWNNASVSSLSTSVKSGTSTNGVYSTTMLWDVSSYGVPLTAAILEISIWAIPSDNTGGFSYACPAVVNIITRLSGVLKLNLHFQYPVTTANSINNTNSKIEGRIRYIS